MIAARKKQLSFDARHKALIILLTVLVVSLGSVSLIEIVKQQYQIKLASSLKSSLKSANDAILVWQSDLFLLAENIARNPKIIRSTEQIMQTEFTIEQLKAHPAQEHFRHEIIHYFKHSQLRGFFIINKKGISLSSSRDVNIGSYNLLAEYQELLQQAWEGETRLSKIINSDVDLTAENDPYSQQGNATAFILTPIRNAQQQTIALLALRINPYQTLFKFLDKNIDKTTESYAFDNKGLMLSESRFVAELPQLGLLKAGETTAGKLILRDPGRLLSARKPYQQTPQSNKLTLAVRSAINKESAINLEGYRDYRGVAVVGSWLWNEQLNMGLITEQEVAEAYDLMNFIELMIYIGALLTIILLLSMLMVIIKGDTELKAVQLQMQAIVETANDGILLIDSHGIIQQVNQGLCHLFAYSDAQLLGQNINMLMPEPHQRLHNSYIDNYINTGHAKVIGRQIEASGKKSDGTVFPVELNVNRIDLSSGIFFSGIIRDITERKLNEQKLQSERDFSRNVLDSLTSHIAVLNQQGDIILTNRAWRNYGNQNGLREAAHSVQYNYLEQLEKATQYDPTDESIQHICSQFKQMCAGSLSAFSAEYPCHGPDNDEHWFNMLASVFTNEQESYFVVSHNDITDRIKHEQKLDKLNQQLKIMSFAAQATNHAVVVTDPNGLIEWTNSGFETISGYSLDEIIGTKPGSLLQGPETSKQKVAEISRAIKERKSIQTELVNYHKNGQGYWVEMEINPVFNQHGELIQFVAFEQDVTEKKRLLNELEIERDLADSSNRLRMITEQAMNRSGIAEFWTRVADHKIIRVNDRACEYLGYSRDEFLKLSINDIDSQHTDSEIKERIITIKEEGWARFESVHKHREGSLIPVEITSQYQEKSSGEDMMISFVLDISERKKSEIALIRARTEAVKANKAKSSFLAAMSHEIRTPLNGVVGALDMLWHSRLQDSQINLVNTALDSSRLLQGIIDDILDFSKIEADKLELESVPVCMEHILESLADNIQHQAAKNQVELISYCDPDIPTIMGDPVRIKQILFNLAGNAIKFSQNLINRKGRVLISITQEAQKLLIRVSDNGIGMDNNTRERLFKPFSQGESDTTRRFGGTGLGLVITSRLISTMQGTIEVGSEPDVGSLFIVELPLTKADVSIHTDESNLEDIDILLVNSDKDVFTMLSKYLNHAGAEVVHSSLDQAVEKCRQCCDKAKEPVVVIDTHGDRQLFTELRTNLQKEIHKDNIRFVLLERGQRRYARVMDEVSISLDLNAMHRNTLINAVASVVNRESTRIDKVLPELRLVDHPVSVEEARREGKLILLAEDNTTNQKVISQQLQMLGYACEVAENGKQALEKYQQDDFYLLLTDCHMPEMDGYELARTIRHLESDDVHMPIIAITADALKGTAQRCYDSGMDAYISKPLQMSDLREVLTRWMETPERVSPTDNKDHQRHSDYAEISEKLKSSPLALEKTHNESAVDGQVLPDLLGIDDPAMLADFYQDFLNSSSKTIEQIHSAYQNRDINSISELAHKLKSSARTVGAQLLADCCLKLELAGTDIDIIDENMPALVQLFSAVEIWIEDYKKAVL